MPEWSPNYTVIGRLMFRYRGTEQNGAAPGLRLRAERLLGTVGLRPARLMSGAVLIVRSVSSLSSLSLASQLQVPAAWAASLRQEMASLYKQAARPALGPISPGAASVLFADEAEMLACLTGDLVAGRAQQQWYWRQVLRDVPVAPGAALTALWSEQAEFLPAALSYLGSAKAQAAIATLSPQDVRQVVTVLHARFDLSSTALVTLRSRTPTQQASADSATRIRRGDSDLVLALPAPPWWHWTSSEAPVSLSVSAHYLLGLGLVLHYAPAFARSSTFATQATSWLQAGLAIEDSPSNQMLMQGVSESRSRPVGPSSPLRPEQPLLHQQASISGSSSTPKREMPLLANEVLFGAAQPLPQDGISTQLAGALYLISLLTWLNLPGGWGDDETLAEHLSGWSVVEALARGLLGTLHQRHRNDPLWKVLAALDGRAPEMPIGASLPQQSAFRLPAAWLRRTGAKTPTWVAARDEERLLVFDELACYLIADIPLAGRPLEEVVAAEIAIYQSQGVAPTWRPGDCLALTTLDASMAATLSPTAAWWLVRVLSYARYFLVRALGADVLDRETLAEMLLCRSGQVLVSRTHLDLHMPLDAISVPVRRAGLDCDPGWIPDLGRIILFHFD